MASERGPSYPRGAGYPTQSVSPQSVAETAAVANQQQLLPQQQNTTPIFLAILNPNVPISTIESIVEADPRTVYAIDAQNRYTALHYAARRVDIALMKMLLDRGSDLEARGSIGETPLLLACQNGSLYAVHFLVERGANLNVVDSYGRNVIHYTALVGALHIMHYLLTIHKVEIGQLDKEGNSALHYAVLNRNTDTVRYLLRNNRTDVSVSNSKGITPLHIAAKHGSSIFIWNLLNRAASTSVLEVQDANGSTPIDVAWRGTTVRHRKLAKKMESWVATPSYIKLMPWLVWFLYCLIPGSALLAGILLFSFTPQPVLATLLAVIVAGVGFFYPMTRHRIPHDANWQNPSSNGALVSGVVHTLVCYFAVVWPQLWPGNIFIFCLLLIDAIFILYTYFKFEMTNPGFEKVGKTDSEGNPLTIWDVARQSSKPDVIRESFTRDPSDGLSFCASCEIVIPNRSKHCKLCEGCCNGFDHHCMWLTKCVGYNNHRLFVLFTLTLGLANFIFIWESYMCLAKLYGTYHPWHLIVDAFFSEHWILFVVVCNLLTGLFSFTNLLYQLSNISKMETTYFDLAGRPAYKKKRERQSFSLLTRLRLIQMFFMDYPRWYRRNIPVQSYDSACYPRVHPV